MNITIKIIDTLKELQLLVQAPSIQQANDFISLLTTTEKQTSKNVLSFKTEDGFIFLKSTEILFIEIMKEELTIHTAEKSFVTKGRLYKLLTHLEEGPFVQVHKSFVLNYYKIKKLENSFSGNMLAYLENGAKVTVSRRYLPNLKDKIGI